MYSIKINTQSGINKLEKYILPNNFVLNQII